MNRHCASVLVSTVLFALVGCSSSTSGESPGDSGAAETATATKMPGESCKDSEECACAICKCTSGGSANSEWCNSGKCATVKELCDQACGAVSFGGKSDTWSGESSLDPTCAAFHH